MEKEWYWVFVRYFHNAEKDSHRFQAENDDDAVKKAREWCVDNIGNYNSFAVAKECFNTDT